MTGQDRLESSIVSFNNNSEIFQDSNHRKQKPIFVGIGGAEELVMMEICTPYINP